jgi:restriction endonuclease S subunit
MEKSMQSLVENIIPNSVEYSTVGDVTENSLYGLNSKSSEEVDGYRYLRITDIEGSGNVPQVPNRVDISREEFEKYKLETGDLVLARSGATVGKSYVKKQTDPKMVYASYLIRFKLNESMVIPEYLQLILKSQRYWNWVENTKRKSAQANINAGEFKSFEFPLPSKQEQEQIIQKYEDIKKVVDSVSEGLNEQKRIAESLSSSILSEAFKGSLVEYKEVNESDKIASNEYDRDGIRMPKSQDEGQQSLGEFD